MADVRVRFEGDARDAVRAAREVRTSIDDIGGSARTASTNAERLSGALKGKLLAGAAVAGAAGLALLVTGARQSIKAASDLNEQISKANVVFRASGGEVVAWSKTLAASFGLSARAALEAAGTFGNMLVPMGVARGKAAEMSKSMVELAGDMASFNNADPSVVLEALRSGLAGETEPLRRFGVFLSDARLKTEALNMGLYKGKGVLDAKAKALATYSVILKDTKDAQGDFARTSESAANADRVRAAQMENVGALLGNVLLPLYQRLQKAINDLLAVIVRDWPKFVRAWEDVRPAVEKAAAAVKLAVELTVRAIGNVVKIVAGVIGTISALFRGDWSQAWQNMRKVAAAALDSLLNVFLALPRLLGAAALELGKELAAKIGDGLEGLGKLLLKLVGDAAGGVGKLPATALNAAKEAGGKLVAAVVDGLRDLGKEILAKLAAAATSVSSLPLALAAAARDLGGKILTAIGDGLSGSVGGLAGLAGKLLDGVKGIASGAGSGIYEAAKRIGAAVLGAIGDGLTGAIGGLGGIGEKIAAALAGIGEAGGAVYRAAKDVGGRVLAAIGDGLAGTISGLGGLGGKIADLLGGIGEAGSTVARAAGELGGRLMGAIRDGLAAYVGVGNAIAGRVADGVAAIADDVARAGRTIAGGIADGIRASIGWGSAVFGALKAGVQNVADDVIGLGRKLAGWVKEGVSSVGDLLSGAFAAAVNKAIAVLNAAIGAYNAIPIAPNIPKIPYVGGGAPVRAAPPGRSGGPDLPPARTTSSVQPVYEDAAGRQIRPGDPRYGAYATGAANGLQVVQAFEDGSAVYENGFTYDPDTGTIKTGRPAPPPPAVAPVLVETLAGQEVYRPPGGGVKMLAAGGVADAMRAYIVGEQGPELFIPSAPGRVVPNYALRGLAPAGRAANGMLIPGTYTPTDPLVAGVSRGEAILNPRQLGTLWGLLNGGGGGGARDARPVENHFHFDRFVGSRQDMRQEVLNTLRDYVRATGFDPLTGEPVHRLGRV